MYYLVTIVPFQLHHFFTMVLFLIQDHLLHLLVMSPPFPSIWNYPSVFFLSSTTLTLLKLSLLLFCSISLNLGLSDNSLWLNLCWPFLERIPWKRYYVLIRILYQTHDVDVINDVNLKVVSARFFPCFWSVI